MQLQPTFLKCNTLLPENIKQLLVYIVFGIISDFMCLRIKIYLVIYQEVDIMTALKATKPKISSMRWKSNFKFIWHFFFFTSFAYQERLTFQYYPTAKNTFVFNFQFFICLNLMTTDFIFSCRYYVFTTREPENWKQRLAHAEKGISVVFSKIVKESYYCTLFHYVS